MKKIQYGLLLLLLMLFFSLPALAQEAPEITKRCSFRAGDTGGFANATDGSYKTYWKCSGGVTVTVPKGQTASAVTVKMYEHALPWKLQVKDENDEWTTVAETEGSHYTDTLMLPEGTTCFRLIKGIRSGSIWIAEMTVYGTGELPASAQIWQEPAEKADLLLIVAHPDDEVLWFGGALPTYAGEYQKEVQVCMAVPTLPRRRLELLDALWTCGVRHYPVWGSFADKFATSLNRMYKLWKKDTVYKTVVGWIRRFKPDVLLTHDVYGEYGHGAHRALADAVLHTLDTAADEKKYTESAKLYGTWEVPKTYLHLWKENVVDMDWRQPLSAFGGKTGFDVACEAFKCHVSQQQTDYHVEDWGPWDCSLFGLVRSLVGEDVLKNDFFENLDGVVMGAEIQEEEEI